MRSALASLALALLTASAAPAQDLPAALQAEIETARTDCAAFENGTLEVPWEATTRTDLTGDGTMDLVLDLGKLRCSSSASLYCGTGGCSVLFAVGETVTRRLSKGWSVERLGPMTVVLNQRHGSDCGGTNLRPCVEAMVWDPAESRFSSLAE
ncbi:hypothetical protein [Dinoroseobacter sp. S124A]|uniref:hypothetical protein n=1 Tax=Dinoroseobacter sp. S124A TaxID=3415128 RepID=UPI003C7A8285